MQFMPHLGQQFEVRSAVYTMFPALWHLLDIVGSNLLTQERESCIMLAGVASIVFLNASVVAALSGLGLKTTRW